jgi:hypothetical protein
MFQPVNHIVEADIKGFFDTVPHECAKQSYYQQAGQTSPCNG